MYFNFIITFFITTFFSIQGSPLPESVYEAIKSSERDANLKCPYVRTTKLLEPKPEVLLNCASLSAAQSITKLNSDTEVQDALCLLYYDNFECLCYVSNNSSDTAAFLSNKQIEEVPKTYQRNGTEVCAVLKSTPPCIEDPKSGLQVIHRYLKEGQKCERICTDLDDNVKPICSLTAFMISITMELNKHSQNLAAIDMKSEKGATTKTKSYGEEDNHAVSGNQNREDVDHHPADVVNKQHQKSSPQQNTELTYLSSSKTQTSFPESLNSGTQNPAAQNQHIENQGNNSPFNQNAVAPQDSSTKQGNTQPFFMNSSVNKLGNQSKIQNGKVTQMKTTPAMSEEKGKDSKSEEQGQMVGTLVNTEPKPEGSQTSNNFNVEDKNNDGAIQKPKDVQPPSTENKLKKEKTNPDISENADNKITKPLDDGNFHQGEQEHVKEVVRGENVGEQGQNNKLSTKKDAEVEAAGESPQDIKGPYFLDNADDDTERDPASDPDVEYNNPNEPLPKSSEVKTKPAEKSKPRETDEDGPSFAANYQNQNIDDSDSYFFSYFMMVCIMFICGYVAYHNKQKILALVVEGRRGRRPSRTRRPNSANYRKLDSNLEEAVTSSCQKNATQVIY